MKKIFVATKARGFLVNLFNCSLENFEFIWQKENVYEVNSRLKLWLSKIYRSRVGNYIGLIQRININKSNFDIAFSYNRFLKVKKNYIVCLENPTALFHYSLGRNETKMGKRKVHKYLNDTNLKSIICISKACYSTVSNFYKIPNKVRIVQIYPLIPRNPLTTLESITEKSYRNELKCLYVSSDFILKGGRDILESFKRLNSDKIDNISLKIITRVKSIDKNLLDELKNMKNVEIIDFTCSKEELNALYNDANVLLIPTRQDSFPLVVLEAIKSANVVISSDLYAIPEMVENNFNGFLLSPKYRFFGYDNMPNKEVWNNRKETIYLNDIDKNNVMFLYNKLKFLNEDRIELERLSKNSFIKGNSGELSEEYIKNKWAELLEEICLNEEANMKEERISR